MLPPPPFPAPGESWALFLDFDGTLTEIVATPDRAAVDPAVPKTLLECQAELDGAVAIVSGRRIEEIDTLLAPARLAVAGLHGLECRDARGRVEHAEPPARQLEAVRKALIGFAQKDPRLIVEDKGAAIALHFRLAPEQEAACVRCAENALQGIDGYDALRGKMVIEVKPRKGNKGKAIERFTRQAPFAGRRPVFAGDDTTDEDGFAVVNRRGGISVKVGDGETQAAFRVGTVDALLDWLHALPARTSIVAGD